MRPTKKNKPALPVVAVCKNIAASILKTVALISFTIGCTFLSGAAHAQNSADTADNRFHDDLLNHLVGKWNVTAIAHGSQFTSVIEAKWVLNHQYLLIHLKSNEVIPWWHVQMEFYEYIGYNHTNKRYVVHGMSIEGDEDPSEGFGYAYRRGNEFKVVMKFGTDSFIVQRHTWLPTSRSWHLGSRWEIAGKESEVFLDMKLVAIKPLSKKVKTR